jgi:4-aminobutyrate aminotransferase
MHSGAASRRSHYTVAHALRVLENHFSPAVPRAPKGNNIVCASARGSYITDVSGKRYLDFQNGIGVSNTGHSHPKVVAAITKQIQDGIHLQQNCMISQPTIALCEKLLEVAPKGLSRFFFNCTYPRVALPACPCVPCSTLRVQLSRKRSRVLRGMPRATSSSSSSSPTPKTITRLQQTPPPLRTNPPSPPPPCAGTGSEAVESAVKLARHETGKQNVIVFNGGFHGRSLTTLAMTTSKGVYRVNYGPLPSGFHTSKYPYCLHCPSRPSTGGCCGDALETLRTMLKEQTAPSETAAIVIEPILGEGGYTVPPPGFLPALRALCDEHGILLIADEVQSGVGRTGRWWGVEHEGVTPDILIFAKAIASGVPLSGIMARPHFMRKSPPGSMGGTYGATAIAASAAVATLGAIQEEGLLANAQARGEQLQAGLQAIAARHPGVIADVRGRGCMVGLEFSAAVRSGFAGAVTAEAMERGLLLFTTGWRETIRLIPALIVTQQECDTALQVIEASIAAAAAGGGK